MLLLVKQRLARLVPGWVTQGSCGGAVIEWVYYISLGRRFDSSFSMATGLWCGGF